MSQRPAHLGLVLDLLSRLPGADEVVRRAEDRLHELTVAGHTAALAARPDDPAAYLQRGTAHARRNQFAECYIRPLCYYGSESLGLRGHNPTETAVLAWDNIKHIPKGSLERGGRMTLSPYVKFDARMMCLGKCVYGTGEIIPIYTGRITVNEVERPALVSTLISPLCAFTIS